MGTTRVHLESILSGLSRTHGDRSVREIERILCGVLEAGEVRFTTTGGAQIRSDTTLEQLLGQSFDTHLRVRCGAEAGTKPRPGTVSRFREGSPEEIGTSEDERFEEFVHQFSRLEDRHDFMWAGYIVRELLPRLGYSPDEAKLVLDRLRADEVLSISKVANPKNPDFPATGVRLNREHPRVRAVFEETEGDEEGVGEEAAESSQGQ